MSVHVRSRILDRKLTILKGCDSARVTAVDWDGFSTNAQWEKTESEKDCRRRYCVNETAANPRASADDNSFCACDTADSLDKMFKIHSRDDGTLSP